MLPRFLALAAAVGLASVAAAGGRAPRTSITVWSGSGAALGGAAYGGVAPATGALVVERRDIELAGNELQLDGVAHGLDPASVQLRDLGDPGLTIVQQRFAAGALTPTEMIARHVGEPITVATPKGEISGTLRAVDEQTLAIEVGARLEVLRRDYVQSVRLATGHSTPHLAWKVAGAKPGKHAIEVSYRTDSLAWSADYLAVLDDAGTALDFSAWATIKNETGTSFDDAQLTLVGAAQARFEIPAAVHLGGNDAVQVELIPARRGAKARAIVTLDTLNDASAQPENESATDCAQFSTPAVGTAGLALELDLPATPLPDGRLRLFRRTKDHLEVVSEDDFHPTPGHARVKLAGDGAITSSRHTADCTYDEPAKVLREKVEIAVQNTGKQAADVVVHDVLWRSKTARIELESAKGTTIQPPAREYRIHLAAGGRQGITYTVVYQW